jgi:hypothetical protein
LSQLEGSGNGERSKDHGNEACECYWNARRRFDQFLNELSTL